MEYKLEKTKIKDCFIVKTEIYEDERGYFSTPYVMDVFEDVLRLTLGYNITFVQDNESFSKYGVVRGIHFQQGEWAQSKLVRCSYGLVRDVIVDLRHDSGTYGKHVTIDLSDKNGKMVFVPKGCGHGFSVLSTEAIFNYKVDNYYNKESEGGIVYNDPTLKIDWGVRDIDVKVSNKDKVLPTFKL
jgi:dTDP-4-dehydrorhamnose 3,5-epimerase